MKAHFGAPYIFIFLVLALTLLPARKAFTAWSLAWDQVPANFPETVVGYKIKYGLVSQQYTMEAQVNNVLIFPLSSLPLVPNDVTYFFTVVGYNASQKEVAFSDPAKEAVWTTGVISVPSIPTGLRVGREVDGVLIYCDISVSEQDIDAFKEHIDTICINYVSALRAYKDDNTVANDEIVTFPKLESSLKGVVTVNNRLIIFEENESYLYVKYDRAYVNGIEYVMLINEEKIPSKQIRYILLQD